MEVTFTDRIRRTLAAHWFCLVPLLPFVAMFTLHRLLGLSDEIGGHLVGQRPASTIEIVYNYLMVAAFYLGVQGYVVFAAARAVIDFKGGMPQRSETRPPSAVLAIAVFVVKLALLGVCWYAFLIASER
ncbi:MAG: hypothetical protein JNG89_11835 [Planctomycetaceae bacterium]|nr:hypothetical protein [Planctomycetaceae bacterium]